MEAVQYTEFSLVIQQACQVLFLNLLLRSLPWALLSRDGPLLTILHLGPVDLYGLNYIT